jgi:hypothetical protein
VKEDAWVEFALSTPDHQSDWQQLRTALQASGVECVEGASDVGTLSLLVAPNSFDHAKQIAAPLITSNSLTVRVKKQKDSPMFEIYQHGKKVAEQNYSIQ